MILLITIMAVLQNHYQVRITVT